MKSNDFVQNYMKNQMEQQMNVLDTEIHDCIQEIDNFEDLESKAYTNLQKKLDTMVKQYTNLQNAYIETFCKDDPIVEIEKKWYQKIDWTKVGCTVFVVGAGLLQTRWIYLRQQEGDIYKPGEAGVINWMKLL